MTEFGSAGHSCNLARLSLALQKKCLEKARAKARTTKRAKEAAKPKAKARKTNQDKQAQVL